MPQTFQSQLPQLVQSSMPVIKTETCSGMYDLFMQYWWVFLIIIVAFLYYKHMKDNKKEKKDKNYAGYSQ